MLSEKNISNALLLLAIPLGVPFEDTMPTGERVERLVAALAELNKPCLLVIDNANEEEDLTQNYQLLRSCSNFHLLLTTRITEFQQANSYPIGGLNAQAALELFKKYYPKHISSEDALFEQMRMAVGENTLVIELLAKNLNEINHEEVFYPLSALLKDLQQKGLLAIESVEVDTGYGAKKQMRHATPVAIIEAMYELGELSEAEVNLLSVFAVLPAENIPYNTLKELLHPEDTRAFAGTLKLLYRKGWLDRSEIGDAVYYKVSPVIQEIVQKKTANSLRAACRC